MIYETKMYSAKCDHCQTKWVDEHTGFVAFTDESFMKDTLLDSDWIEGGGELGKDGEYFCPECFAYDRLGNPILNPFRKDFVTKLRNKTRSILNEV